MNAIANKWFSIGLMTIAFVLVPFVAEAGGAPEEPEEVEIDVTDRRQAPQLSRLVDAGELPPLEERLPANPIVIEPREEIGTYGGRARSGLVGAADGAWLMRTIDIDGLVHWNTEWNELLPAAAASYSVSEDARTYTFELREGLRWHDGERFTSADVEWWYENEALNEELNTSPPGLFTHEGVPAELEVVDEETFRFIFAEPHALFLDDLAGPLTWTPTARHYGEQFHADFNDDIHEIARAEDFDDWVDYYDYMIMDSSARWRNPDLPSVRAWTVTEADGYTGDSTQVRFVRNPYYYRVDTDGNQLPYIDEWVFRVFEDREVLLLDTLGGNIDVMVRHINTVENRPVFEDYATTGDFRLPVMVSTSAAAAVLKMNMTHDDEVYREVVGNRDFRIGLSHAIDREEIIDILYAGATRPRQPAPSEEMPWFNEQLAYQYTEYDPDLAVEYFERAGLEYNADGRLLGPDGEPIVIPVSVIAEMRHYIDELELIQQHWDAVGVELEIDALDRTLWTERQGTNLIKAEIRTGAGAARDALVEPRFYFPYSHESVFAQRWSAWYGNPTLLGNNVEPEEPPESARRQMELYDRLLASPPDEHADLMAELLQIAADEFWVMSVSEAVPGYGIVHNRMGNSIADEGAFISWVLGDPGIWHFSEWFIRDE